MKIKEVTKMRPLLVLGFLTVVAVCGAQPLTEPGWYNLSRPLEAVADGSQSEFSLLSGGEGSGLMSFQGYTAIAEAITPEIQALAQGLENDPVRIFNYVHDHIRHVFYFGAKKGAQLTLLERSGNDFDQCALLVALLRAAGYSPTYQFGMLKLPYESANHRDVRHWLQLSLPNTNYSATVNYFANLAGVRGYPTFVTFGDANSLAFHRVWVKLTIASTTYYLDPAFKVSEPITGIDLMTAMGLNTNDLVTAASGTNNADFVQNLNEAAVRNKLRDYTTNLIGNLQSNFPNASVPEILGGWKILPTTNTALSQTLPFANYDFGGQLPVMDWNYQPTNLMSRLTMTLGNTNYQFHLPALQGQRLTLTFDSAGLGQLWLEDTLLLQMATGGTAPRTNVTWFIHHPFGDWNYPSNTLDDLGYADETVELDYQRRNATYLMFYGFETGREWQRQRQKRLDAYRQQGLADTSRQVVCETLNVMALSWLAQTESTMDLLATQWDVSNQHHHRFGRMAQEATNGYYVDAFMQVSALYSAGGNSPPLIQRADNLFDIGGYFRSAYEHGIIEQTQNGSLVAASTVKMLQLANTNSLKVFLAASNNWTAGANIRSQLTNYYLPDVDGFINSGYTLLLPRDGKRNVAGAGTWSGFGAVLGKTNANGTRALTMFIAGGYNGGYASNPNASPDPSFVSQQGSDLQQFFDTSSPFSTWNLSGADPVAMADGSFIVDRTDLSVGQTSPRGFSFARHYSSARRHANLAGMAHGWTHNYNFRLAEISAPEFGLGESTPQQMAAILVATRATLELYKSQPNARNWLLTALIAKWGVDQLINNSISVTLGKDTVLFVKQPDGSFTPPANCKLTLLKTNSVYQLVERHGNTFKFDGNKRLTNIVDQYNQALKLTYNSSNWVTTVTDWKNRVLTLNYSGSPLRLTSVTNNGAGRSVIFGYATNAGQLDLSAVTDPENKTYSFLYGTNHLIVAATNAQGQLVTTNIYDDFGRVVTQYTRGDTNQTWRLYWSGFVNVEQDPSGNKRWFFYDEKARVVGLQDALGNTTQTFYDGQDHVVMTVSPLHATNRFEYDGRHNLLRSVDPLNYTNQFFYDTQDRLVRTVDARGSTNFFGYNAQHSLTGTTNGAGDWVTFLFNSTDGTLTSRSDSGGTTGFDYDSFGQLSAITYPGGLGGETLQNSASGDVTNHTNARGFVTSFQYNLRRELTNTIAPTNRTTRVAYDAVGNVGSVTDARGFNRSNTWSATRQLLTTTLPGTPQGVPVITNVYDNRDWLARTLNPLQQATVFTNDAAQRLISRTDPLQHTTRFGYDNDSLRTSATNAANEVTRQTWSPRRELTQTTTPLNTTVQRGYDAAGNQIILTNRNGKPWQFQFDAANRLTNTITPLGRETRIAYDARGLVSTLREPSTQTATNFYDAKGRLTNSVDAVASRLFRYDAINNLTNLVENGKTNAWTYDAYDQVATFRDADGNFIQYRYDANGNLTNLIYPGNRTVTYFYDSLNRLTNITDWANRKTSIEYDLASQVKKITRPNGTERTMDYDAAGQTTNIWERLTNGTPIALFKFQWNDAARMDWEFAAPLPHAYTPPTRSMTFDDDNRLATFNGNNVTHDADGNLTSGPLTNNTFATYGYDARNRLTNVAGVSYAYDPAGTRTGMTNGANLIRFVINPNAALSQVLMRVRNGVTNFYIYGLGLQYEITETATTTNTLTYHYDYRGSTIALTDDGGNVTDRIEYSPYATMTYRSGTNDTPFLFNGRYGVQTDPNGLLYMRARYYNPYLCRFLNADPSGFAGGLNFYAYADGNPVSMIDPFGLYGNPVSGPNGPIGPASPYAPGGAFYVPTPQLPPTPFGPVEYFVGGAVLGAGVAAAVVFAAPVAVSGLVAAGMSTTAASATITTGLGVAGAYGAYSGGKEIIYNYNAGNWNAVAYGAGTFAGGLAVGVGGGGRAVAEGIMGKPSPAPNTWDPITILKYEWAARYQRDFPDGSLPTWMASAPTPASGGASGTGIAAGQGSWITPTSGQSSPTGK